MENKRLLRLVALLPIVGLKRSAVYARVADGRFPQPVHVGRASAWHSSEIADFVEYVREHRHEPPAGHFSQPAGT